VNLRMRCGNGSPEWLDWITQHCCLQWYSLNKTQFDQSHFS
jgi:hypothetical protein